MDIIERKDEADYVKWITGATYMTEINGGP